MVPGVRGYSHGVRSLVVPLSVRVLSFEGTTRVFEIIDNFAEENALFLPGRVSGSKRADLSLLPSTNSKASILRDYYKPAMETTGRPNKINKGIKAALGVFLAEMMWFSRNE